MSDLIRWLALGFFCATIALGVHPRTRRWAPRGIAGQSALPAPAMPSLVRPAYCGRCFLGGHQSASRRGPERTTQDSWNELVDDSRSSRRLERPMSSCFLEANI